MIKVVANWLLAASLLIWCSPYAWAENVDSDKAEYLSHCAECHGLDGKGNGPRASKLKAKPSDLTLFEKKNKGVFPLVEVYSSIDMVRFLG
jgi:mono/diheme cytochrome c family protein